MELSVPAYCYIGAKVNIVAIEAVGTIRAIVVSQFGTEFRVNYWLDGKLESELLPADELSPVQTEN